MVETASQGEVWTLNPQEWNPALSRGPRAPRYEDGGQCHSVCASEAIGRDPAIDVDYELLHCKALGWQNWSGQYWSLKTPNLESLKVQGGGSLSHQQYDPNV